MTEMANPHVCLVNDYFNQSSPPQECLLRKTDNIVFHLVFSPNKTILHSKLLVCIWVGEYLCNNRVYVIVSSHEACEVHLLFYMGM